ncbi:hypothetical protein BKA66DRAFT_526959 [Pyrenochaeta sp. MPI-SDFR-AT-0127]|nr:hypothetical protein BKA66DRAFT_526959 [Pyrenochaeta sp. MPI-SDFR-AT-0127]
MDDRTRLTDALIQAAAFPRKEFRHVIIKIPSAEHADVLPSIATPFSRTPDMELGSLDRLPLELWYETLFYLDMRSLFMFRQTNRRSRQIVDSLKEYQLVISHGLEVLCALLRTELAVHVSLFEFYTSLCTKHCALCGHFAGFIFIPTWTRCCSKCIEIAPETHLQTVASVRRRLNLTPEEIAQLNPFTTLLGVYSLPKPAILRPIMVVSIHQAIMMCNRRPRARPRIQPARSERDRKYSFAGSCVLPYYHKQTGRVEFGVACSGCELARYEDREINADNVFEFSTRGRLFSENGFLQHFIQCKHAQVVWGLSSKTNDEWNLRHVRG